MPDIVIAGATFRNVPQIDIPKEGSGTASFVYEDGTKQITENGTNIDVSGYAAVDVAVPSSSPVIQSLSVTQNGEYTAPSGVDGYSPVTVNVPGIVPSGSQTVTENGTYDVASLAEMVVNVSGGGGGGASNLVQGEFTVGDTGAVTELVDIPYSGSGYPLYVIIQLKNGLQRNTDWGTLIKRYAVGELMITKSYNDLAPDYNTNNTSNNGNVRYVYKGSQSSPTTYGNSAVMNSNSVYKNGTLSGSNDSWIQIQGNKRIAYRAANGTVSTYGLLTSNTYTYAVIYSE